MCSQVKFEPDEPHSLCPRGHKVAKSQISDLTSYYCELNVILK